jgi:parallel beta-helix repeat protein
MNQTQTVRNVRKAAHTIALALTLVVCRALSAETLIVKPGQSIQAAVTRAVPGDRIEVEPGVYSETVFIDKDNITLHGIVRHGDWPILDGNNKLDNGVLTSGHGVTIEYLWIRHFKGNGLMTQGSNNYRLLHNVVEGPCFYAIFPQYGKNGLIAYNVAFNSEDAAIYVGMSDNVDVRYNETFGSFTGIEGENSHNILIEGNHSHDNSIGISASLLPGLPLKTSANIIIRRNVVENNNIPNKLPPGSVGTLVPSGLGVLVLGTDRTIVEDNLIVNNESAGIYIAESSSMDPSPDEKIDPFPNNGQVLRNLFRNNGTRPQGVVADMLDAAGLKQGVDVMSTGKGHGNCIVDRDIVRTLGTGRFEECPTGATSNAITSLKTREPVGSVAYNPEQKGRLVYLAVCSGCHTWDSRLLGPPMITVKAIYGKDAAGLANWIAKPVHKRTDYPEMPAQDYLSPEVRLSVAKYILNELSH